MLQRRQREILSSSDGRERQMEFYLFFDYLSDIMKDPFLDICSFVEESQLDVLEKRALVTKDTFTTARVYKNWLPKNKGNEIFILEKVPNMLMSKKLQVQIYFIYIKYILFFITDLFNLIMACRTFKRLKAFG